MTITNLSILDTTTVGTPSGNYDGSTDHFISTAEKAVDYYQGQGSLQTVFIRVTDFEGVITLQATLDYNADQANWFDVYEYTSASSQITDYHPVNLTGNFVWMRAAVSEFNAGTINNVTISY
jgi:hypothetical protein